MTPEEEKEIEMLLESRSLNEVTALTEQLTYELNRLEIENITELSNVHSSTLEMLEDLKKSSTELNDIRVQLSKYDDVLARIKQDVEQIERTNNNMEIVTRNLSSLSMELDNLLRITSLPEQFERLLQNTAKKFLFDCNNDIWPHTLEIADALDKVITSPLKSNMADMAAVKERRSKYSAMRDTFFIQLSDYLMELVVRLRADYIKTLKEHRKINIFKCPDHKSTILEQLQPYQKLVHKLIKQKTSSEPIDKAVLIAQSAPSEKSSSPALIPPSERVKQTADMVITHYCESMVIVYKSQFKYIFKAIEKMRDWKRSKDRDQFEFRTINAMPGLDTGKSTSSTTTTDLNAQNNNEAKDDKQSKTDATDGDHEHDDDDDDNFTDKKLRKKLALNQTLEYTLKKVLPLIKTEQEFVTKFFRLEQTSQHTVLEFMFQVLQEELLSMISEQYKYDPFIAFQTEILLLQYSKLHEKDTSYIPIMLKRFHDSIYHLFINNFIKAQTTAIVNSKLSNIRRIGILEHVKKLISIILKMDNMGAREAVIIAEQAYNDLINTVFQFIWSSSELEKESTQASTSKLRAKLILRIENFHHLYKGMEACQIPYLDKFISQAKNEYSMAINGFINEVAQQNFSQLMTFFDGVDKIYRADPMQVEIIQYQDAYSNRVLAKMIKKYPLSLIAKGLYSEYKKLNKNLSTEEGLLNTVWDKIKEFMVEEKWKRFEHLVSECYKNIRLEFSRDELSTAFKEVVDKYKNKYKDGDVNEASDDEN
eukprot:TRINITY_DN4932_c0_g3_i1.p1 TRINITY_DN4932_c0_g3~~TRINITY_DN4932_c0_g3_i1.p1  ORF type:complete len:763 (-),score=185.96 TRINITY_DN4932_c0_g3_i1:106-2394(-)